MTQTSILSTPKRSVTSRVTLGFLATAATSTELEAE